MMTAKNFFASESWRKFRELKLPRKNIIAGVCASLGNATPFAAWMWRALFCATTIAWGFGLITYIILWICVPNEDEEA